MGFETRNYYGVISNGKVLDISMLRIMGQREYSVTVIVTPSHAGCAGGN